MSVTDDMNDEPSKKTVPAVAKELCQKVVTFVERSDGLWVRDGGEYFVVLNNYCIPLKYSHDNVHLINLMVKAADATITTTAERSAVQRLQVYAANSAKL